MGCSVVQCLDCKEWNWANAKFCHYCGSRNLTVSFAAVCNALGINTNKKENKESGTTNDGKL